MTLDLSLKNTLSRVMNVVLKLSAPYLCSMWCAILCSLGFVRCIEIPSSQHMAKGSGMGLRHVVKCSKQIFLSSKYLLVNWED